jgi:hypothetical protein
MVFRHVQCLTWISGVVSYQVSLPTLASPGSILNIGSKQSVTIEELFKNY